jgi:hypothetical protein
MKHCLLVALAVPPPIEEETGGFATTRLEVVIPTHLRAGRYPN